VDDRIKEYFSHPTFRLRNAAEKFFPSDQPLPPMPSAPILRTDGFKKSKQLSREDLLHAFLALNYAKMRYVRTGEPLWADRAQYYVEYLVRSNASLIIYMFQKLKHRNNLPVDEALSHGLEALLRAVHRYDANRGTQFSTVACISIQRQILGFSLRKSKSKVRQPTSALDAGTMNVPDPHPTRPLEALLDKERTAQLKDAVAQLPERERIVIERRWMLPEREQQNHDEVGKIFGVSKERARQIEVQALRSLREILSGGAIKARCAMCGGMVRDISRKTCSYKCHRDFVRCGGKEVAE
jgi:RNA polymerase sigma factor (sigma-70 family)